MEMTRQKAKILSVLSPDKASRVKLKNRKTFEIEIKKLTLGREVKQCKPEMNMMNLLPGNGKIRKKPSGPKAAKLIGINDPKRRGKYS